MAPSRPPTFEATNARVTVAALELHRALRDALERALPRIDGARACGRALGLRRHLGWQVYAIARTADHAAIMRALPKSRGWTIVFKALHDAGCPETPLKVLREAIRAMDRELASDTTAGPVLRAAAAGALDTAAQRAAMLKARANATRANALLHGVSVKTYLSSFLIGPAGAGGEVGMATATSIHGIRRTRPGPAWPIYYTLEAHDEAHPSRGVTTMKHRTAGVPPLVRDLSSSTADGSCLRMHRDGETLMVELLDRGPANTDPLDLAFVEHLERVSTLTKASARWRLLFLMTTPTDRTVTEVWFHRSVTPATDPSAALVSSPNLNRRVLAEHGMERLPLEVDAVPVDHPSLPAALRKHSAVHAELLSRAAHRLGAPIQEFNGFQLEVPNPPWMSMVAMSFDC
jgi:hypothetical protein